MMTMREIKLASFNVRNLALPGKVFYEKAQPYSPAMYESKISWLANQLDESGADVIGLQEVFSPEALPQILAKTRHYKEARAITMPPEADGSLPITPNVALVSRLPVSTHAFIPTLPENLQVPLPGDDTVLTCFTRPVLHAMVEIKGYFLLHILVAHFKSRLPDAAEKTPAMLEMGALRSLIRRGTDALGLRRLVTRLRANDNAPVAVLGDFNDFPLSIPLQILSGDVSHHALYGAFAPSDCLYSCYEMQPALPHREKHSPFYPDTDIERIDHILVSEEFTAKTGFKLGKVSEVRHFVRHLYTERPETSDHGMLMATLVIE